MKGLHMITNSNKASDNIQRELLFSGIKVSQHMIKSELTNVFQRGGVAKLKGPGIFSQGGQIEDDLIFSEFDTSLSCCTSRRF